MFLFALGGTLGLCLTEALSRPDYHSFVNIDNAFRCLAGAELFFFVFLWPQFAFGRAASRLWLEVVLLWGLSVPLVLTAASVADAGWGSLARSQALLACAVLVVIAFARLGVERARWYYLGATLLCGALPLMWYLVYDVLDVKLSWLAYASPFWAMDLAAVPGGAWPLPTMIGLAGLSAALWAAK